MENWVENVEVNRKTAWVVISFWSSNIIFMYRIMRFVIENTIEERILKLQEKKELVFEG